MPERGFPLTMSFGEIMFELLPSLGFVVVAERPALGEADPDEAGDVVLLHEAEEAVPRGIPHHLGTREAR